MQLNAAIDEAIELRNPKEVDKDCLIKTIKDAVDGLPKQIVDFLNNYNFSGMEVTKDQITALIHVKEMKEKIPFMYLLLVTLAERTKYCDFLSNIGNNVRLLLNNEKISKVEFNIGYSGIFPFTTTIDYVEVKITIN